MSTQLRRHEPDEIEDEETGGRGKRWTLVAALIVVAAVVIGVAWIAFTPSSGTASLPAYSGPVVAAAPANGPAVGACNFPKPSGEAVTIAPTDVEWALAGSMATPSSKSAGPETLNPSGIPACYERSPQGALMAASNWATVMQNPKVDKVAALTALVARTGGYEQMVSNFEGINAKSGEADIPAVNQIAAFRMLFFDQSHAEIELVFRTTSGNSPGFMAATVYVLVWEKDDWKIAPVLDGNAPITRPVTTIAPPYIPFNGA